MPKRVRVERGLYRTGKVYAACATPKGSRTARWKTLGDVGLMEARRGRDAWAVEVRAAAAPQINGRSTVGQIAQAWVHEIDDRVAVGDLAPRTRESYLTGIRNHVLTDPIANMQIAQVTPDDLVAWHRRQQGLGAAKWSIHARWTALRGVLGHAARHRLIIASPADALTRRERPGVGESRLRYLSAPEIERLLAHTPSEWRYAMALLLFCGLRASEACGLTWADVLWDPGDLNVDHQLSRGGRRVALKTARSRRHVILMPALADMLATRQTSIAAAPEDAVIPGPTGGHLSYRTLLHRFAAAREAAGLGPEVTPHVLRHTFASLLISQGRDVEFVSRQLGHANTAITWNTYVHLFRARENAQAARDGLDDEFGGALR